LADEFPGTWVRKGDWKLIRCYYDNPDRTDRLELYNLKDDVGERHDLAQKMPEKVRELNALITRFLADTKAVIPVLNPAYDREKDLRAEGRRQAERDEQAKAHAEGKW
jgi:arylsulfatase A-like enzyme